MQNNNAKWHRNMVKNARNVDGSAKEFPIAKGKPVREFVMGAEQGAAIKRELRK